MTAPTTMSGASVPAADRPLTAALWMVHVLGPDEIYPAPDHATAVQWCADLNGAISGAGLASDVLCVAIPALWTGTDGGHAAGLADARDNFSLVRRPAAITGDDWIEWHGGENPVPGKRADVIYRSSEHEGPVTVDTDARDWSHDRYHPPSDIIAYRLARPAASDEGVVDSSHGSVYDQLLTLIHDRDDALRGDDRTDPGEIDEMVLEIMKITNALASPPVSERERELEGALDRAAGWFEDLAAGAEVTGRPAMAASARLFAADTRRALTAQPAGEGK